MDHNSEARPAGARRTIVAVFAGLGLLGLFALWSGVRIFLDPSAEKNAFVGPLLIGSILTGVGLIMPFVLVRAGRREAFRQRMQQQHPGQPWAWRKDWQSGRIGGSSPAAAKMLWLVAVVWNGFTWPVAWLFLSQPDHPPGVYMILAFPAIGVIILILAIRGTLQARKYGTSMLLLKTNPGVIGRTIEADIETRIQQAPDAGFDVRLECSRHYTTGHGKNRRTHRQTLWKDHVTVQPADLTRGPLGLRIPVTFAIPQNVRPSDDSHADEGIQWLVSVNAMTAGVDYSEVFEVPVFATGATPLTAAERDALMAGRRAHAAVFVPDPESTVMKVRPSPIGGTEFFFKPKVKITNAVGAIVMTALSWAGTYYLFLNAIPVAPWIVGFFAVLFSVGTLFALFHSSRVSVNDEEVVIRHRVLGVGTTTRLMARQIVDIRSEVVGEGNAQSFEVKVFTSGGKSFSAGAMIPTQLEADWAAEQLRGAILKRRAAV